MLEEEVSAYLASNGHPGAGIGSLPATTPDDAFALWVYDQRAPAQSKQSQDIHLEYPRFQVITRSKSYVTGRLKMERIYRLLAGFSGELSGVKYHRISIVNGPRYMDRDELNRARFIANFEAKKEPSPLA